MIDLDRADLRANMPIRNSDCINVRESVDTVQGESLHKPPEVFQSVDMGMTSDDTVESVVGSIGSGAINRLKKQVVLRKPYIRNQANLIKSTPAMQQQSSDNVNQLDTYHRNSLESSQLPQ